MRLCNAARAWAATAFVVGSLGARAAQAHQPGVSLGEVRVDLGALEWTVWISYEDWTRAFFLQGNMPVIRSESELLAARPEIERALIELLSVEHAGHACEGVAEDTREAIRQDHPFAQTRLRFTCGQEWESLTLHAPLARYFLPQHRMFVTLHGVKGTSTLLFGPGQEDITVRDFAAKIAIWPQVPKFIRLGIEHIFTGYDHVLFLIGLILGAGRLRSLITIVTSFTVAHTATLAAATLGYVSLPPRFVEPLIALSIVYIAVENLWREPRKRLPHDAAIRGREQRSQAPPPSWGKRWMVTFGFGLIHGLGFSSILLSMNIPRSLIGAGLLSFNLGVEIGQVAIVAVVYPLLHTIARFSWQPKLLRVASAGILVAGSIWLMERTAFAHPEATSYARIEITDKTVRIESWIGSWEWQPYLPREMDPTNRRLSERELVAGRSDVDRLFSETIFVKSAGQYCPPKVEALKQLDMGGHNYLACTLVYTCRRPLADVRLDVRLPRKFGGGHQMIASIAKGKAKERVVFTSSKEVWTLSPE
ncbi:MAG: HupE/UreJ family protein [Nitrospirae bacterium]|nr:HupE/UreJ family protein [Nitrospirota bacterium]